MNLCDHISLCPNPWPKEPDGTIDTASGWCDDNPHLWEGLDVAKHYRWRAWAGLSPGRYPLRWCRKL